MGPKEFTLTEQHIKLLRRAYVDWQYECETGAPAIDPKRPYGNSSVVHDIADIFGEKASDPEDDGNFDDEQRGRFLGLHRETETALQIVLVTGSFEPGRYVRTGEYDARSWRRADAK